MPEFLHPPESSPADERPITLGLLIRLTMPALAVGALFAGLVTSHVMTSNRLDALESRVTKMEQANNALESSLSKLNGQLSQLNRKLDIAIVCMHTPQECDSQLRLLGQLGDAAQSP